jgi:hypothetical protein
VSNNPDSFIDEVSDELRRERLTRTLRRWGWIGVLAIVAIVGGAAFNEWQKARATARAEAFGDALRAAAGDPADLAAVPADSPGQRAVAALARAAALVDAGDTDAAVAVLAGLADDPATDAVHRDLARTKALALDPAWPDDGAGRAALLDQLAVPGAPFRPLALEQRALDAVAAGDRDAARETLGLLADEPALPPALAQRIGQMRAALGMGSDG